MKNLTEKLPNNNLDLKNMKDEQLQNFSYAKLMFELIKFSNLHKFKKKLYGYEKFEKIKTDYPLYKFVVNPESKLIFYILTGMHGDEIAGPLSIYCLLKEPEKYLNQNICYHIYPVVSPTAFDLRRRYDDDNVELNTLNKKTLRNYKYHEIKSFYEDIKNSKPDAFLSLHEDMDQEKFYAYVKRKNISPVYRAILKSASRHCGVLNKKIIDKQISDHHGLIDSHDQTTEDWLYAHKHPEIFITTETPGKIDLNTRIMINLENIRLINNYILKMKK